MGVVLGSIADRRSADEHSDGGESVSVDYEAVTRFGTLICTFGDADSAKRWLFDRRHELPGAVVIRVTRSREVFYRPRLKLVTK